jgi:hypothetical protein
MLPVFLQVYVNRSFILPDFLQVYINRSFWLLHFYRIKATIQKGEDKNIDLQ